MTRATEASLPQPSARRGTRRVLDLTEWIMPRTGDVPTRVILPGVGELELMPDEPALTPPSANRFTTS